MLPAGTKIFGIGLNKTGTTTLGTCLKQLGYRHLSFDMTLMKAHARGDHATVFRAIERFESFEDWPFPLMFRELFERYGDGARFVLTTRATPEIWLSSFKAHTMRTNPLNNSHRLAYGYDYPHGHEAEHLAFYAQHNAAVRTFFAERKRGHLLLEVCWENDDGWKALCAFLQRPIPDAPFPHEFRGDGLAVNPAYRALNERNIAAQLAALARRRTTKGEA